MFVNNCCLLCLEHNGDPIGDIDIDSAESRSLGVPQILQQYFKTELNAALAATEIHSLCRHCWDTVFAFHQFCLRVQRAHIAAVDALQSGKAPKVEIDENTIKIENCVVEETSTEPPKRRRGRPRKKPVSEPRAECSFPPGAHLQIEELQLPCLQSKDEIESSLISAEQQSEGIKDEALQEQPLSADYVATTDNVQIALGLLPEDQMDDEEAVVKRGKKMGKRETKELKLARKSVAAERQRQTSSPPKTLISKKKTDRPTSSESDAYIAQHFALICCLCDSPQDNFAQLKRHFRAEHQTRGYVHCCGRMFLKRGLLLDHIHMHQDPDYFKCPKCGKSMGNRKSLDSHLKNHEDPHERTYQCDTCSKSFFKRQNLMQHLLVHVPADQRHHPCTQCGKTFATNLQMVKHVNLVHLRTYSAICDICGKSIQGREAMKRHMDEHAGIELPPVQCEVCGRSVKSKYMLTRHMRRMHTVEYRTPQTCRVCGKVSPSLRQHHTHMRYMHTMPRKHSCHMCDKAFRRPKELREHMTTHTGEDLYICTFCPRTFKSNANMYSHRKKMHPKEWAELNLPKSVVFFENAQTIQEAGVSKSGEGPVDAALDIRTQPAEVQ